MIVPFLASALLVAAASSAPSAWEELHDDLAQWELEEALYDADAQADQAEDAFHGSDTLFPPEALPRPSSRSSAASSSRASGPPAVTIDVDGRAVVLRDVPPDSWFAPFVSAIARRNLISGYRDADGRPTGLFGPGDSVTTGQLIKVLVQAGGGETARCTGDPALRSAHGHWSASFVRCAEANAWSLLSDAALDVDRPATRAEVIGTLLEALRIRPAAGQPSPFTDVRPSTPYAAAIIQAQANGIISGYQDASGALTGRFGPHDPVTRAEFAKIVTGGLDAYGK